MTGEKQPELRAKSMLAFGTSLIKVRKQAYI